MPRFSANLNFLFGEIPFLDRFAASKDAGFRYVEYMFPYEHEPEAIRTRLTENGLRQVLFNMPAGDWSAGDRGLAAAPHRIEDFRRGVSLALRYADALGVGMVNCLTGTRIDGLPEKTHWDVLVENLWFAASELARVDKTLLVEPINIIDIPGFYLNTSQQAQRLLDEVGAENLKIQYDVYHMQKMEGNLIETIRRIFPRIGHVQIADNPGRHQPGTGEINYGFLLTELENMGYNGFVGLEYIPKPDTTSSLGWVNDLGFQL